MLSLEPPFIMINDVWVFEDHQDDNQFYYLPRLPRLSRDKDGNPIFKLLYVRDQENVANGGILNFQTDLGIDQSILDEVKKQLPEFVRQKRDKQKELGGKNLDKLPNNPRLIQVMPMSKSSVELLLLGTNKGGTALIEEINHAGKPALYGDNQAIFAVNLKKAGAQLLRDVLENAEMKKGESYQIGVIYKIFFEGIKPAFRIKGRVNLSEVAKHIREHKKINALFFKSDIEDITSTLVRKGVVELDTEILTTGASVEAEKAKVMEWITKMFFEAKPNPAAPDPAKEQNPLSGIFNSITGVVNNWQNIGYSVSNLNVTQEQNISFNAEITQRNAVEHFISPQTFLTNMFKAGEVSKYIDEITLNVDPFYKTRKLDITSTTDFKANSIALMTLNAKYGDSRLEPLSVSISEADFIPPNDATKLPKKLSWLSEVKDGRMVRPVKIKYKVIFKNDELRGQRPSEINSKDLTVEDDFFLADPFREGPGFLFITKEVKFVADSDYPWTRYSRIEVQVKYTDDENKIKIDRTISLSNTTAEREKTVRLFIMNWDKQGFKYQVRHIAVKATKAQNVLEEWKDSERETIYIEEPAGASIPGQWNLKFDGSDIDWSQLKNVTVTLKADPARGIPQLAPLVLSPTAKSVTFAIQLADQLKRELLYDLKLQKKPSGSETISECVARNDAEIDLTESGALAGGRYVQVKLLDGDFNPNVTKIVVKLRHDYNDQSQEYTFTASERNNPAPWRYHFRNDKERPYEYRIDYLTSKGSRVASIPAHKTNFEKSEKLNLDASVNLPK